MDPGSALVVALLLVGGITVARKAGPFLLQRHRAQARAKTLLTSLLSARQRQQLKKHKYFDVPSRERPGWFYRLRVHGRIEVFHGRRFIEELCVYVVAAMPREDQLVAFKASLEGNEEDFLSKANHIRVPHRQAA